MVPTFTKNFQTFVDAIPDINCHEIYDLHQVSTSYYDSQSTYTREQANGSEDIIIGYKPTEHYLRLSPKALAYFSEWIEQNLMEGMDADAFYGFHQAIEK